MVTGLVNSNSNGAFSAGYTGAPIDNGLNCTSCHGGQASSSNTLILSNIPSNGYIPNTNYLITVNAQHPTFNRFGFMLTAQNHTTSNPTHTGTWTLLNNQSQLRLNNRYVSHTSQGTQGSNNARIWEVQWTAPPAGTGPVAFYASVNAVNNNGTTSGDQTILGSLIANEATVSVYEHDSINRLQVYPNPAIHNYVIVHSKQPFTRLDIYTVDGRRLITKEFDLEDYATLELHGLASGIYILHVTRHLHTLNIHKIWIP